MKTKWRLIIISVVVGLVLVAVGISLGASRAIYMDGKGVHLASDAEVRITEPDIGYFMNVDVETGFCDVEFVTSDKYGFDACGYGMEWDWSLNNDTLRISHKNKVNFNLNLFRLDFSGSNNNNYVKVYVPNDAQLGTVDVNADSGDVNLGRF